MDVTTFSITADLVAPIVEAINSGLTTLVPIGIGIMAIFIGEDNSIKEEVLTPM